MNIFIKGLLDKVVLKGCPNKECEKKDTQIAYGRLPNHLNSECEGFSVVCPAGCGVTFKKSSWKHHYEVE